MNLEDPGDGGDAEPDPDDGDDDGAAQAFENANRRRDLYGEASRIAVEEVGHKKGDWSYSVIVPELLEPRTRAIFEAEEITATGGDPGIVGRLMTRLDSYFDALGIDAILENLVFGNSVTLDLRTSPSEAERQGLLELLETVEEEEREGEAVAPQRLVVERLAPLVPRRVARLETATRILNEPVNRVAERVRLAGTGPRDELRKLSDVLQKEEATLRVESNVATNVSLTHQRATTYARRLREPRGAEPIEITIVGRMNRTDSDAEEFRVVLDRERMPPELGPRRQVVEGGYTDEASQQVRDGGLWDHQVVAHLMADRSVPPGGGKPLLTDFTFLDVRLAA